VSEYFPFPRFVALRIIAGKLSMRASLDGDSPVALLVASLEAAGPVRAVRGVRYLRVLIFYA
jgi:hypothetical protein